MKRFTVLGLLAGLLTVAAANAGEPARGMSADGLEVKQDAPKPEQGGAKEGGEGDNAREARELVQRIAKGMQRCEKRLGEKDPSETTQQVQRDVVKALDELIKRKENEKGQGGERKAAASQGTGKYAGEGGAGKELSKGQGKEGPEKLGKDSKGGKDGGISPSRAKGGKARQRPLAELYRRWGELPERTRQEMDAYARERPMERFRELLRDYYRAVGRLRRQADE
jgi:hypothetical protein